VFDRSPSSFLLLVRWRKETRRARATQTVVRPVVRRVRLETATIGVMAHWLLKTEPTSFSIDDLARKEVEHWDGVRNFQARNNLRAMRLGEEAFFYHSSTGEPGIAGICNVVREAYPDESQFDPNSKYFDPRALPEKPRWYMPDVRFVAKFAREITLAELRTVPGLANMVLLHRSRLSVQPVADEEWNIIVQLAGQT
jgi:predicted RNA-binding protein with PUA-like domain